MLSLSRTVTLHEFPFPSQEGEENPATFVFREPRRREYRTIMELLGMSSANEDGDKQFDIDSAYELASVCLEGVKNVEVDGKAMELSFSKGRVAEADMDLFEPRDVFALAMKIMASASLTHREAEK